MEWDFGSTALGDMLGFGSDAENSGEEYAKAAAKIAKEWWNQTGAIRDPLVNRLADFMNNGMDPSASPMFAPGKLGVEQQYENAMDNILANLPAGGALGENLTSLEMGKAGSLVDLIGKIIQDEYNKAYGLVSGTPQQTFAGLDAAANNLGPVIGSQAQTQSAQWNALGNIMG